MALWSGVDPKKSRRSEWKEGWDRDEKIQGSILRKGSKKLKKYLIGGYAQGQAHLERSERKGVVVEVFRQAAYEQRAHLAVDRSRWEVRQAGLAPDGKPNRYPVYRYALAGHSVGWKHFLGQEMVDAARHAYRLARCEAAWRHSLRLRDGGLGVVASPERCGLVRWCPICAALHAAQRAAKARSMLEEALEAGLAGLSVLMTLTQRGHLGETYEEARDRFKHAFHAFLTSGPQSGAWERKFKSMVSGIVWGIETPRSWEGKKDGVPRPPRSGRRWHDHGHIIVTLHPGVDEEEAARVLGERWEELTRRAGSHLPERADGLGWGWDPESGGVPKDRSCWSRGDWWKPMKETKEVFQATKYLLKPLELDGQELLEALTFSKGHRFQGSSGIYRGLTKHKIEPSEVGELYQRPDPGEAIAGLWQCPRIEEDEEGVVSWPVRESDAERVRVALAEEVALGPPPRLVDVGLPGEAPAWRLVARREWARSRAATHTAEVAEADLCRARAALDRSGEDGPSAEDVARLIYAQKQADKAWEVDALLLVDWCEAPPLVLRCGPLDPIPY